MAGYFKKLVGRVYDGEHKAKVDIANGVFATLNADGEVIAVASDDANTVFRCVEKTTLWGLEALRLDVISIGGEVYMTEADFPVTENQAYDETTYVTKAGELVKMKRPLLGEQIIISVPAELYAAASVNDQFSVASGGGIEAVSD